VIQALVACDDERGIGREGALPWNIPEDLKRFKSLTLHGTVLMGRATYFSLPNAFRPLPQRKNVVISRTPWKFLFPAEVECWTDLPSALSFYGARGLEGMPLTEERPLEENRQCGEKELWIIGGGEIYRESLRFCNEIYVTRVRGVYQCDTFLAPFEEFFERVESEERSWGAFERYARRT
jgi:dihydrofolate reductase